jgi:transposase
VHATPDPPQAQARRGIRPSSGGGRCHQSLARWVLLTDKQAERLNTLFADDAHAEVEVTRAVYQQMVAAYRDPDRASGKARMAKLIESLSQGVPAALTKVRTLGRTLKQRAADGLAYFDRPGSSNGPTEALNGRLEHLRGSALGFRNLTNYIAYAEVRISDGMSPSGLC